MFPWNEVIDLTSYGSDQRAVVISLSAIHEQLCVIADLLRERGQLVEIEVGTP